MQSCRHENLVGLDRGRQKQAGTSTEHHFAWWTPKLRKFIEHKKGDAFYGNPIAYIMILFTK